MAIEITVPRLGWSMEEGTFSAWLKNAGDRVEAGDPLFALDSDKVTMDVESLDSGILHILSDAPGPGAVVTVGQRLGYLLAEGEKAPVERRAAAVEILVTRTVAMPTGDAPVIPTPQPARLTPVSPRARAMAKSLGIDVSVVSPKQGSKRIVEADVRSTYERLSAAAPARKTVGGSRKVIAARMEESFRTPHFYVHAEADASSFVRLREEMLPVLEQQYQVRVTYNDLLVKAIALALRALPRLNCSWDRGEIVMRSNVHVGLAVEANDTVLVPVIRDADRLTIAEIAAARQELVERCRRSEAKMADLEDGSVTLSNLGPFGVDRFQAILNPPQSAIVAAGRISKRPFVDGDSVVARLTLPLSISVDHRAVDGVAAARFLNAIVELLQSPVRLLLPPPA